MFREEVEEELRRAVVDVADANVLCTSGEPRWRI
jgi:hypothetical protein